MWQQNWKWYEVLSLNFDNVLVSCISGETVSLPTKACTGGVYQRPLHRKTVTQFKFRRKTAHEKIILTSIPEPGWRRNTSLNHILHRLRPPPSPGSPPLQPETHRTSCSLGAHPVAPLWRGQYKGSSHFPAAHAAPIMTKTGKWGERKRVRVCLCCCFQRTVVAECATVNWIWWCYVAGIRSQPHVRLPAPRATSATACAKWKNYKRLELHSPCRALRRLRVMEALWGTWTDLVDVFLCAIHRTLRTVRNMAIYRCSVCVGQVTNGLDRLMMLRSAGKTQSHSLCISWQYISQLKPTDILHFSK